jgi:hypothetical protein
MATCHADNVNLYKSLSVFLIVGETGNSPGKLKFCWRYNKIDCVRVFHSFSDTVS